MDTGDLIETGRADTVVMANDSGTGEANTAGITNDSGTGGANTVNTAVADATGDDMAEKPRKISRWSYERHIVKCPLCGRDVLDHMTECPFCKQEITVSGYKPMSEGTIKTVKIVALIAGIIIAAVIILPILIERFGLG